MIGRKEPAPPFGKRGKADVSIEEPEDERLPTSPPGVPAEVFTFEGSKVVAWFDEGKWTLYCRGYSAVGAHLGTTSRILFNPSFHEDTRPLVEAILEWHAGAAASAA